MNWLRSSLLIIAALIFQAPAVAQSIQWNVGMFSRANCGNNESITWERNFNSFWWNMEVESHQMHDNGDEIFLYDGPAVTSRVAAISWLSHWTSGWVVEGTHMMGGSRDLNVYDSQEAASLLEQNCDGWAGSATGSGFWTCKVTWAIDCSMGEW